MTSIDFNLDLINSKLVATANSEISNKVFQSKGELSDYMDYSELQQLKAILTADIESKVKAERETGAGQYCAQRICEEVERKAVQATQKYLDSTGIQTTQIPKHITLSTLRLPITDVDAAVLTLHSFVVDNLIVHNVCKAVRLSSYIDKETGFGVFRIHG